MVQSQDGIYLWEVDAGTNRAPSQPKDKLTTPGHGFGKALKVNNQELRLECTRIQPRGHGAFKELSSGLIGPLHDKGPS